VALHRLDKHVKLAATLDEVWAFFSDPRNLPVITPPSLGLRITSPVPGEMYPGMIITYSVSPIAGIRLQWVTEITHVVERRLFVDEQRSGPYRFWHHQHHFREVDGGVEASDIVHYALPFGILGDLVQRFSVRRQLDEIFDFRLSMMRQRFTVLDAGAPVSESRPGDPILEGRPA
jgi:ligand-binding SRPBCC domain-containing protein